MKGVSASAHATPRIAKRTRLAPRGWGGPARREPARRREPACPSAPRTASAQSPTAATARAASTQAAAAGQAARTRSCARRGRQRQAEREQQVQKSAQSALAKGECWHEVGPGLQRHLNEAEARAQEDGLPVRLHVQALLKSARRHVRRGVRSRVLRAALPRACTPPGMSITTWSSSSSRLRAAGASAQ